MIIDMYRLAVGATVTQDKDNFSRAEIGLFLPLWFTFYDTFPVVSFFLLNIVLIYPKLSL